MKRLILLSLVVLCSCSSKNDFKNGKKQLESMGYTHIENTGYTMFCCSNEDSFKTGFKAKDKNGNTVKGCLCSTFFKGVTIRFR